MSSYKLLTTIGEIPKPAPQAVTFFSNNDSLMFNNQEAMQVFNHETGAVSNYGGRVIAALDLLYHSPDNVPNLAVIEQSPDQILLEYLNSIGLRLPEIKVCAQKDYPRIFQEICSHPSHLIDGSITDENLTHVAQCLNKSTFCSFKSSHKANNKLMLIEELRRLNLPVFTTEIAYTPAEVQKHCATLARKGYQYAVIKAQIGAGGIGSKKCTAHLKESLNALVPEFLFYEGPCLVQGWIDDSLEGVVGTSSPSVQLHVDQDQIILFDITEQIIGAGSMHIGNIANAYGKLPFTKREEELLRQATLVGEWLYRLNYRGSASIDFHVTQTKDSEEIRVCEVNARTGGGTFPSLISRKLNGQGVWLMRNVILSSTWTSSELIFNALNELEILYVKNRPNGCFPYNLSKDATGRVIKSQFIFFGDCLEEVKNLLCFIERTFSY